MEPSAQSPSPNLLRLLAQQLAPHPPFRAMRAQDLQRLLLAATEVYYAAGETVCSAEEEAPRFLNLIRQGEVTVRGARAASEGSVQHLEAGDMFPIAAVMGRRPVRSSYQAASDLFCLRIPVESFEAVVADSPALADFLANQTLQLLEWSRRELRAEQISDSLHQQSLERPLGQMLVREPISCRADASIRQVLQTMHEQRIGAMLVVDDEDRLVGIFTRQDVINEVALAQAPLDQAISEVMTLAPRSLSLEDRAEDAALLMSRHGFTHVPVLDGERLAGIVSERDLFALQRLSLKRVSSTLRQADSVDALVAAAGSIRELARALVSQGMLAKSLTALISHLNDLLTERLLQIIATEQGVDLEAMCWLSFGSEGRSEQTISTDQDNGLIFDSDQPERDRPRYLAFAERACHALDACGYPLCKGNIMASNPACCLTLGEWRQQFSQWIEHGSPEDLLKASIFFDLRPLAGRLEWGQQLQQHIARSAQPVPRFQKMLASELLRRQPPLNWFGGIETHELGGHQVLDLKLQGAAIYVDVARLQCLALGLLETNTRERFEAVGRARGTDPQQIQACCAAFEYLQMLRLQAQLDAQSRPLADHPNTVEPARLNEIDRRLLKESLRIASDLQKAVRMDYGL